MTDLNLTKRWICLVFVASKFRQRRSLTKMIEYIVRRGQKYDTVLKIDRIHSDVLVNKKISNMISSEATSFFS